MHFVQNHTDASAQIFVWGPSARIVGLAGADPGIFFWGGGGGGGGGGGQ